MDVNDDTNEHKIHVVENHLVKMFKANSKHELLNLIHCRYLTE